MACILLCESYKFGEKIYYNNWYNEDNVVECEAAILATKILYSNQLPRVPENLNV